jgi:hypothetical protein
MSPWQGWELSPDATDCAVACVTIGLGADVQLMQPVSHFQKLLLTLCYFEPHKSYTFAVYEVQYLFQLV